MISNISSIEDNIRTQLSNIEYENQQSVVTTQASDTEFIDVGDDTYITSANDGMTDEPGVTSGIAKSEAKYVPEDNELGSALQVAYAAQASVRAEVYQEVHLRDDRLGDNLLRLSTGVGYRGSSGSALSGGSIEGVAFIRPKYGDGEETIDIIDVDLGLVDGWGETDYVNEEGIFEVGGVGMK